MTNLSAIEKALHYELTHKTAITSITTQIMAGFKPQQIKPPFIVQWLLSEIIPTNVGVATATFQIDILGLTIEQTETLSEAVKSFNEFGGNFGNAGVKVNHISVNDLGLSFEEEISAFRKTLEFRIKFLR
jgi:hypothetical protein